MYQSSVLPRYEMTKLGVLDKVMGTVTFMSPPSESRQVTLTIYDYKKLNIHKEVNFPTDTVITHMKRIKGFTPQSSWFGSESKRPNPNLFSGDKYGG
jgi:hypothetical protein